VGCAQPVIRCEVDRENEPTRRRPVTVSVVVLMVFLALLAVADLLPLLAEPRTPGRSAHGQ